MPSAEPVRTENEGSFHPLVQRLIAENPNPDNAPMFMGNSPFRNGRIKWIEVGFPRNRIPTQGWKLHISALVQNAEIILERVIPVLMRHETTFKCVPSRLQLQGLNQGEGGMTQVGKFITIYPENEEKAVALARELAEVTVGLEGPRVPTDSPLAPESLVHYRYGAFSSVPVQSPIGQIFDTLKLPDGTVVKDKRDLRYHAPIGIDDPFQAAGLVTPLPAPQRLYGGRFLHISTIYHAPRNTIHVTVDLEKGQRAILKQVSLKMRVGAKGNLASAFLRNEAEVLQAVGDDLRFPSFYALFEQQDSLFLAMEDVQGGTFERLIAGYRTRHELPGSAKVVQWGREIASMLAFMHSRGWIHRDLKSTNILVAPDGYLRLIDFDLASPTDKNIWGAGFGTRGYTSPQQIEGTEVSVQDDIYGLGGLLYFAATLAETSQSPNAQRPLERPVEALNPRIHPALVAVIQRCLAHAPEERYATIMEVEAALAALEGIDDAPLPFATPVTSPAERDTLAATFRQYGLRLAESLLKIAMPVPNGGGLAWVSTHSDGAGIRSREINTGSSGSLYALIEFADKVGIEAYREAIVQGAKWLTIAPRVSEPMVPGLYVGEGGIAAALLRAGQLLQDENLLATALVRANKIAAAPLTSPDLFNGAAGRLRLHLWAWRVTGDSEQLAHAQRIGQFLAETALGSDAEEAYWTIPQGFEGLSGHTYLGYSHGAAGIADALLDLYEATGDTTYYTLVAGAARWLIRLAVPVMNGEGLAWAGEFLKEAEPVALRGAFWCHGATGIGLFLARVAKAGILPMAAESAARAAYAVAFSTRWSTPTQCHGLAGNIDFLLTLYQSTGDSTYLEYAYTLGKIMLAFVHESDGLWLASSESPTVHTPDYMVGYAGVAVTLLRLSMPDTFLHPFRDETLTTSLSMLALA